MHPAQRDAAIFSDSLGMGVALASGLTGLAHISVHIRGLKALRQIAGTSAVVDNRSPARN
jgi:hypothetical protein